MKRESPKASSDLRALLHRSRPSGLYDVEAGLERHRKLLSQGAPLPTWASDVPRKGLRPIWFLSALAIGVLAFLALRVQQPESVAPALSAARPLPEVASEAVPATTPLPEVEALPAPRPEVSTLARLPTEAPRVPATPALAPPRAVRPSAVRHTAAPALGRHVAPKTPQASPQAAQPLVTVSEIVAAVKEAEAEQAAAQASATQSEPAVAAKAQPQAGTQAPEAIDPEVLAEMQQLALAERLLTKEPARSLEIVRAGMQRFSPGYLRQERRYVEVMALLALNKPKDAALLGRSFLRDYPNGPYRRKVEAAIESER